MEPDCWKVAPCWAECLSLKALSSPAPANLLASDTGLDALWLHRLVMVPMLLVVGHLVLCRKSMVNTTIHSAATANISFLKNRCYLVPISDPGLMAQTSNWGPRSNPSDREPSCPLPLLAACQHSTLLIFPFPQLL